MLKINKTITLNKYGQGLIELKVLTDDFSNYELIEKRAYLKEIIALILQSKPQVKDVDAAIKESGLRRTFTPCVILSKGVTHSQLQKIADLPNLELDKSLKLLLGLFKVSYLRRYLVEKNNPNKWWYWDLTDNRNLEKIKQDYIR